MARRIELRAPAAVTCRVPFVVTAEASDVTPGHPISITLAQKKADEPARPIARSVAVTLADGAAFARFQVSLTERGTVLLLATAQDGSEPFHPDGAVIEVV